MASNLTFSQISQNFSESIERLRRSLSHNAHTQLYGIECVHLRENASHDFDTQN
jgi:hypothetical protein